MFGNTFNDPDNRQMLAAGLQDMLSGLNRRPMDAVNRLSTQREAQKWRDKQAEISQQRWEEQNARAQQQAQRQQMEFDQKQQVFQQQQSMCASLPEGPLRQACESNPAAYSKQKIENAMDTSGGTGDSMFGKSMEGRANDIYRQLTIKQHSGQQLTPQENIALQQSQQILSKPETRFNPMTQQMEQFPSSWSAPRMEIAPNGAPRVAEKGEPTPGPMNVPSMQERLKQGYRPHSMGADQKFYGPEDVKQGGMMPQHMQAQIDMNKSNYSRSPQAPIPQAPPAPQPAQTQAPQSYTGSVPNTAKGVETLRSSQEQLSIGLDAVDDYMRYLDSPDANVGAVNTAVSKGAATAWQFADVADEFGVPGVDKIKEAADDVVDRTSTATSKMYRTRITQNFRKMFTEDDRLTDKDWDRLEAATVGVEDAVTVGQQRRKMAELQELVVELYNSRYEANEQFLPGSRPRPQGGGGRRGPTKEETIEDMLDRLGFE